MFTIQFRSTVQGGNLNRAPQILRKHMVAGLSAVAKRLIKSSQDRMRKDTGAERNSLRVEIVIRDDKGLIVFSPLLQAAIDSHGLRRGVFAPWGPGSRINNWAKRKLRGIQSASVKGTGSVPKRTKDELERSRIRRIGIKAERRHGRVRQKYRKIEKIAVAGQNLSRRARNERSDTRKIAFLAARAIYRRGIRGTHWNKEALEANKQRILREMSNAMARAIAEMKQG